MAGEWSEAPGASEQQVQPGGPVVDAFENAPVALMRVGGPEHRYMAANAAYRFAPPFLATIARGLDVERIKLERKGRQLQAQSILSEFEVEMGLKKPQATADAVQAAREAAR